MTSKTILGTTIAVFAIGILFSSTFAEELFIFEQEFGSEGTEIGEFQHPFDVATDSVGNIYVTDMENDRVQKFNANGVFITEWGTTGTGNDQFDGPWSIVADSDDNLWVVDARNNRIQKFTSNGDYLQTIGSSGSDVGQFNFPTGIALDKNGNIIVADRNNFRIQIFQSDGTTLHVFGEQGSTDGKFDRPYDVSTDSQNNVYVIEEENNHRLQKFDSNGNHILTFGSHCKISEPTIDCVDPDGSDPLELGDGQFHYASGIEINSNDILYVADSYNHRIQIFSNEGKFVDKFGIMGINGGNFDAPRGISIDEQGKMYVADTKNHRVQVFQMNSVSFPPSECIADQIIRFNGSEWICGDDKDTVMSLDCTTDQIVKFDGDKWQCAEDEQGTGGGSSSVYVNTQSFPVRDVAFVDLPPVMCRLGDTATGGGYSTSSDPLNVVRSQPHIDNGKPFGWKVSYTSGTLDNKIEVHVLCIDTTPIIPSYYLNKFSGVGPEDGKVYPASCDLGDQVTGGGFSANNPNKIWTSFPAEGTPDKYVAQFFDANPTMGFSVFVICADVAEPLRNP